MKHENGTSSDCVVVVSSCDAFSDVWRPFFTLFFRYWPDCPFPIYLISNEKTYPDKRVQPLLVGPDKGWGTNTKLALERIPERYILWFMEDLFLEKPTDTAYILRLLEYLKAQHAATIRLFPSPPPDVTFSNTLDIGKMDGTAPYRVSLLTGLWDKAIFSSLIRNGENAWQMEIDGTERSRSHAEDFFSVKMPILHYAERSAIVRGAWSYEALQVCRREHISLRHSSRSVAYTRHWLQWFDGARKRSWAQRIRVIPGVGFFAKKASVLIRRILR